jgi:hypothetical protein
VHFQQEAVPESAAVEMTEDVVVEYVKAGGIFDAAIDSLRPFAFNKLTMWLCCSDRVPHTPQQPSESSVGNRSSY